MTTLSDLIASIHSALHSYSGVHERVTWLTEACDDSETSLTVAGSDTVMRGLAEVDNELVYVNSSDSGTLSLAPFGRGYRGSTAVAHDENAQVTFDPPFPKVEIRRAIEQCIESLFPTLYQIKTDSFDYNSTQLSFELPEDCEGVIEVKEEAPDPLDYWPLVSRWKYDANSPLTTGKRLNLLDVINPGATIHVTYRAKFDTFASDAATLASVGMSESYADLILYGVTARMIRFLDPARLQTTAVENISRSQVVQAGDAGKIANQLYAMYQQRLAEERKRLLELDPPSIHFTR